MFAYPCLAAPTDDDVPPPFQEPIQDVHDPALSDAIVSVKNNKNIIRVNYGIIAGKITNKINDNTNTTVGMAYDWRDFDQNYWSLGARWLSSKVAWIEMGKKFMIPTESLYEPYYQLSLSHFMDPQDALAGLTRIDSYKASASIGFLDMWTLGRILNVEIGSHWGIPGLAFHAQLGLQWTF